MTNNGFAYILDVFMKKEISKESNFLSSFELKHLAFVLKLLRIFTMAAFSTENEGVYEQAILVRRSSSIKGDDKKEDQRQKNNSSF